ncbi:hypothetical protein KCU82_g49, partial [Aureobasidium melanogenum]
MSSTNISGLFLFSLRAVHRKIGICFMPEDALVQAALFTCPLLLVHQAGFVLSLMMYTETKTELLAGSIGLSPTESKREALYGGMVGASFATEQLLQLILTDASRHLRGFLVLDTERRIETVAKVRFSSLKLASLLGNANFCFRPSYLSEPPVGRSWFWMFLPSDLLLLSALICSKVSKLLGGGREDLTYVLCLTMRGWAGRFAKENGLFG